jgi:RHS repeat-associated protein
VAEQLTYDDLGRVTVVTNALGSFTNRYLGATSLITTNVCSTGKQTVFGYYSVTNDERLKEIWNQNVDGSTLSKFDYGYDALGQITNWTQQTGETSTNVQVMRYDPVNQLLSVTVHGNTVAGAILKQYAYAYDAAGNRTAEQIGTGESGPVAMSASSYNSDNQLTNRTESSGEMLFVGSVNKQPTNVTVAGVSATINRQTTNFTAHATVAGGTNTIAVIAKDYNGNSATNNYQIVVTNNGEAETLTFDANGNQTSVVTATSTNTYGWDAANRLVSITSPTNQSLFTYDGYGRRVQIVELTNGVAYTTNRYLWTGLHLSDQRNVAGAVTKRFFGEGEQINGTNYYFTRDHLGSVREMVNGSGVIQARYDYDPYGRRTKMTGSMDADFGYTGDYFHAASRLCLTLLRTYDPDLGRWLSRDPIAELGGLNLYDYVLNNTMNWLDFYGACGGRNGGGGSSQVAGGSNAGAYVAATASATAFAFAVGNYWDHMDNLNNQLLSSENRIALFRQIASQTGSSSITLDNVAQARLSLPGLINDRQALIDAGAGTTGVAGLIALGNMPAYGVLTLQAGGAAAAVGWTGVGAAGIGGWALGRAIGSAGGGVIDHGVQSGFQVITDWWYCGD